MLKRLIRSRPAQEALSACAAAYMALIARTTRWRIEGAAAVDAALAAGGAVGAVWHGRLAMIYACRRAAAVRPAMLISQSRDGAFIARAAERLDIRAIRGSSRKAAKADKDKGGSAAYRAMIAHVRDGGVTVLTPDGPRGPRMRASEGAARLALQTGAPVLCVGVSAKWRIVLDTWDGFILPLPFGPGAIVFAAPVAPPRDADEVETVRAEIETRLNAATARADEIVGARAMAPEATPA